MNFQSFQHSLKQQQAQLLEKENIVKSQKFKASTKKLIKHHGGGSQHNSSSLFNYQGAKT